MSYVQFDINTYPDLTPARQPARAVACVAGPVRYRAILTSAASKFPLNVVLPFGVAARALGFATVPAPSTSPPVRPARVPRANDNFAAAGSSEYGGPAVVVAASERVVPLTATPAPVSKSGPLPR